MRSPTPQLQVDVLAGSDRGRRLRYSAPGSVTLGRDGTLDVDRQRLTDTSILDRHLQVVTTPGGEIHVVHLGPEGCGRIGSRPFERTRISSGCLVHLGDATLRLTLRGGGVTRKVPRASLSDFDVVEEIGEGAYSRVYEAVERRTGDTVALKRLRVEDARARQTVTTAFLREIQTSASLTHPAIARVRSAGWSGDDLFFTMDFVDGPDLDTYVRMQGPLPEAFVRQIGCEMLEALGHAHTVGLVHRDLKPSNVMLRDDGERMESVLVDFGLAVDVESDATWGLTRTGDFRGTPDFTAPECLFDARRHSVRGDIFGVGATLYFALTGRTCRQPLGCDDVTFEALARSEVVPLQSARPLVDPRLAEVVDRALAVSPNTRWRSAAAMRHALRNATAVSHGPPGVHVLPIVPPGPAMTPLMH